MNKRKEKTRIIKGKGRRLSVREDEYWEKKKTVRIEIEVPEGIMRFAKAVAAFSGEPFDLKEYAWRAFVGGVLGDVDTMDSPFWDMKMLKEKYGLDKLGTEEEK